MEDTAQNIKSDEINLRDLILKVSEWCKYLLSKWKVIVIGILFGIGVGLAISLTSKPKYIGELTFVLEESKSNPLSAYAGLASQFGIDLGGMSSSGVFAGDNILEFLKSRLMIEKTLISPVKGGKKQRSLADLYIETYKLNKRWEKEPSLRGLHFPTGLARAKFSLQQDSILNIIQKRIVKKNLQIEKPDKKLSFISVKCISLDQTFSKLFTERLVKEATDFYVSTKTKRSQVNVDKLQITADSLEILLNRKTFSLAATQDLNLNPAKQVASVKSEVQARDKVVLQTIYGEVIKNLELSKMAMAQETPIVQIVDTPILPLQVKRISKLVAICVGGFLSGFVVVAFLIVRRGLRVIMDNR